MKQRTVIIALVLTVTLASCSRFEDGPAFSLLTPKARLTGEWEIVDYVGVGADDYLELLSDGERWFLEFERDGDGSIGYEYSYGNNSYSYSSDMEWELDENELTIEYSDGHELTWEIQRLTNRELEMNAMGIGSDLLTWVFEKQ